MVLDFSRDRDRGRAKVVLTEWKQYRELHPVALGLGIGQKRLADGRDAPDRGAWTAAGWSYRALGRRSG